MRVDVLSSLHAGTRFDDHSGTGCSHWHSGVASSCIKVRGDLQDGNRGGDQCRGTVTGPGLPVDRIKGVLLSIAGTQV